MGSEMIYQAGGATCHGHLAMPDETQWGPGPYAGVLVAPAFWGLSPIETGYADKLAEMGYVALGVDIYGDGKLSDKREDANAWMDEFNQNRALLAARMQGALTALKGLPMVDEGRIGAVGYCFGGKGVLDLARTGAEFQAGVTMHGVLQPPESGSTRIKPALLICDGWDDPLDPPEVKVAFAEEMNAHCADWQMLVFGHTVHAFTNTNADGYSPRAAQRSWDAMCSFFAEHL
ncbi:dienelactone hydrolase family protein [Rhodalgimonas zhirmunskyi]|uniref:Dienelactone hydrolase family protein n=1 Tax=Rhodalgimonas zhirmunskyi TaxID=2964767 RepID=A0AAJ1X5L7_9RHOB|nr:dienelactone hydrolase family protein [Rhodoalgimonas zhirmunskyi]MDQ2092512.1 dienelactone hydrolase family protein [Rhodoalgimonas zhirmunskyi]